MFILKSAIKLALQTLRKKHKSNTGTLNQVESEIDALEEYQFIQNKQRLMELIDSMPPHEGKTFEEALAEHLLANGIHILEGKYE